MQTYKACSSTDSAPIHMYFYVFYLQDLHLSLEVVVLNFVQFFHEIRQKTQIPLILSISVLLKPLFEKHLNRQSME